MTALFSSPKMPAVAAAPVAPTVTDPSVQQQAQQQQALTQTAAGRASTIQTSGLGVLGPPAASRKTLLGD